MVTTNSQKYFRLLYISAGCFSILMGLLIIFSYTNMRSRLTATEAVILNASIERETCRKYIEYQTSTGEIVRDVYRTLKSDCDKTIIGGKIIINYDLKYPKTFYSRNPDESYLISIIFILVGVWIVYIFKRKNL